MNTAPFFAGQPAQAYVVLAGELTGVGVVRRGERGYGPVFDYSAEIATLGREKVLALAHAVVDRYNQSLGVSKGQARAASIGSMWGWHVPAANPANYNGDGTDKRKEAAT
jgi:hypothetical protein